MSLRESITVDEVIDYLNELIGLDRPALAALLTNRVPCNRDLAQHQSVQVLAVNGFQVGLLGILNGLFGTIESGRGPIALVRGQNGEIERVKRAVEEDYQMDWRGEEDGEG